MMTATNVVNMFKRPNDRHWSEVEKEYVLSVFSVIGEMFFINASKRACKVLAAGFRDLTQDYPEDARLLAAWADRIELRAYDDGRVPYYPNELRVYVPNPASG